MSNISRRRDRHLIRRKTGLSSSSSSSSSKEEKSRRVSEPAMSASMLNKRNSMTSKRGSVSDFTLDLFGIGMDKLRNLVNAGGTINTSIELGEVDGACASIKINRPPPSDSSQFGFDMFSYFATATVLSSLLLDNKPLVFETGTDTMGSVGYFLSLIKVGLPDTRLGCVGSMYCNGDPQSDGDFNRELLLSVLSSDVGDKMPFCVVDKTWYPAYAFQKHTDERGVQAFSAPVYPNRQAVVSAPDLASLQTVPHLDTKNKTYDDYLTVHLNKVQDDLIRKSPPETITLPSVSVLGVTENSDPDTFRLLLKTFLAEGKTDRSGFVIFGPISDALYSVCESYYDAFSQRGISITVVNTGKIEHKSNKVPVLNQPFETSDRAQIKLSWLLSVASSNKLSGEDLSDFLRSTFPEELASEYAEVTKNYYQKQRSPEDASVPLSVSFYFPRQFETDLNLLKLLGDFEDTLVVGTFVNNLNGAGGLTPMQQLQTLKEENPEIELKSEGVENPLKEGYELVAEDFQTHKHLLFKKMPVLEFLDKKKESVVLLGSTSIRPEPNQFEYAPQQIQRMVGFSRTV